MAGRGIERECMEVNMRVCERDSNKLYIVKIEGDYITVDIGGIYINEEIWGMREKKIKVNWGRYERKDD